MQNTFTQDELQAQKEQIVDNDQVIYDNNNMILIKIMIMKI